MSGGGGEPRADAAPSRPAACARPLPPDLPPIWLSVPVAPRGWTAVSLSSIAIFMMGGVVFGLSALYPFLYEQRMWAAVCDDGGGAARCRGPLKCCDGQLVQLSLLASVAFFISDAAAAPWGEVVDRIGGRNCLALSASASCAAFVLLGAGVAQAHEELTVCAVVLLALSGPGVCSSCYIGCLELVRHAVSPLYRASVTAALTSFVAAVVNGSALVLSILQERAERRFMRGGGGWRGGLVVWEETAAEVGQWSKRWGQMASSQGEVAFLVATAGWAVLCGLVAVALRSILGETDATLPLSPAVHAMLTEALWSAPEGEAESTGSAESEGEAFELPRPLGVRESPRRGPISTSSSFEVSWKLVRTEWNDPPLWPTLLQPYNVLLISMMTVLNLICSFYIQSQADQVAIMFDAEQAEELRGVFNIAFPVVGVASVVAAWSMLHRFDTCAYRYWGIVVALGNAFNLLSVVQLYWCQLAAALLFGFVRTLQWAAYFHFVANDQYYAEELTGRAVGYNGLVVALLSDGMPYVLAAVASSPEWGGDLAKRYMVIKGILQLFMMACVTFPWYLRSRQLHLQACNAESS
ncbi:hypothetical protein AB1Y20_004235 [Prymnesium parvum]|uniref:Uncharacterized protein n=1 Tax=Prymnesium parvum TaxID=97485 RepID=A0AB34J6T7_PRYPA